MSLTNHSGGRTGRPSRPVQACSVMALGKQGLALGVHDIVHKDERGAPDFGYPRADMDQIVIPGGPPVAALGFAYGQHDAEAFDLRVTHAHLADVLAAGTFEEVQVFRVIEIPHRIGFSIGDAVGEPNIGSGKIVHEQHPLLKVPQKRGAGTAALAAAVLALGLLAGVRGLPFPLPQLRSGTSRAILSPRTTSRPPCWRGSSIAPAAPAFVEGAGPGPAGQPGAYRWARAGQVAVAHGDVAVTWGDVAKTLDCLEALLPRLDAEPGLLAERFRWVKLKDGAAFSGYYEPVVKASRTRKPGYTAPLYRVPPDLRELNLGSFKSELIGQRVVYRMEKGKPFLIIRGPKSTGWTAGPASCAARGWNWHGCPTPWTLFSCRCRDRGGCASRTARRCPCALPGPTASRT